MEDQLLLEGETVLAYRRHIINLLFVMLAIGVPAQVAAACMVNAELWITLATTVTCTVLLVLAKFAERHLPPWAFFVTIVVAAASDCEGIFFLNNGMDGTHLYPLLWCFSCATFFSLYGAWLPSGLVIAAGWGLVIFGKLWSPDLFFGVGADQSWIRVGMVCFWWALAMVGASTTGRRVISLAQSAWEAQRAVLAAHAKERAWSEEAERLRLTSATDRADTLTDLARSFDVQVRTVVTTVAKTSAGIATYADAVSDTARATGEQVRRAAGLSVAVAEDTTLMAQNAVQLGDSLLQVRDQARGVSGAAVDAAEQVAYGSSAVTALVDATSRVGKAISLIGSIADRTNLLALNAAIESARAGAAGRGFAVVAEEVKQLARRTAGTASEIDRLVHDIHRTGESATAALNSIGLSIGEVSVLAGQVDDAAEGQAVTIGAITSTIASLNDKATEVRLQVSDVAHAATATSEAAQAMQNAATALGRDAGSLQTQAGIFIADVRAA